jgi:hypothetical protein
MPSSLVPWLADFTARWELGGELHEMIGEDGIIVVRREEMPCELTLRLR